MNIWKYFEHIAAEQKKDIDQESMKKFYIKKCGDSLELIFEHFHVGEKNSKFPDLISFFKSCENFADNTKNSFEELDQFYPEFKDHDFLEKYYQEHKDFLIYFNEVMAKHHSMNLAEFFTNCINSYEIEGKDLSVMLLKKPNDPEIHKQLIFNFFSQEMLHINDISRNEAIDDFPNFQKQFLKEHISGYQLFSKTQEQQSNLQIKKKKLLGIF